MHQYKIIYLSLFKYILSHSFCHSTTQLVRCHEGKIRTESVSD
jgi:hypothetical protein